MSGSNTAEQTRLDPASSENATQPAAQQGATDQTGKPAEQAADVAAKPAQQAQGDGGSADPQAQSAEYTHLDDLTKQLTKEWDDPAKPPGDDELLNPTEDERRFMGRRNAQRFDRLKELHDQKLQELQPAAEVGQRVLEQLKERGLALDDLLKPVEAKAEKPEPAGFDLAAIREVASTIELTPAEQDAVDLEFMTEEDARLLRALKTLQEQAKAAPDEDEDEQQQEKPAEQGKPAGSKEQTQEKQADTGDYTDEHASLDIEDYLLHDAQVAEAQLDAYMDEILPEIATILEKEGRSINGPVAPREKLRLVQRAHRAITARKQVAKPDSRTADGRFASGRQQLPQTQTLSEDEQWLASLSPQQRAVIERVAKP